MRLKSVIPTPKLDNERPRHFQTIRLDGFPLIAKLLLRCNKKSIKANRIYLIERYLKPRTHDRPPFYLASKQNKNSESKNLVQTRTNEKAKYGALLK